MAAYTASCSDTRARGEIAASKSAHPPAPASASAPASAPASEHESEHESAPADRFFRMDLEIRAKAGGHWFGTFGTLLRGNLSPQHTMRVSLVDLVATGPNPTALGLHRAVALLLAAGAEAVQRTPDCVRRVGDGPAAGFECAPLAASDAAFRVLAMLSEVAAPRICAIVARAARITAAAEPEVMALFSFFTWMRSMMETILIQQRLALELREQLLVSACVLPRALGERDLDCASTADAPDSVHDDCDVIQISPELRGPIQPARLLVVYVARTGVPLVAAKDQRRFCALVDRAGGLLPLE